jgi:hypothetical protein
MQKNKQMSTKFLVMAITTAAIIAAATTTSLSAATPVFAKVNCNDETFTCTGGSSWKDSSSNPIPGGFGGRSAPGTESGGQGQNGGNGFFVGGAGGHLRCDLSDCTEVGGVGGHPKGPGGNSGN